MGEERDGKGYVTTVSVAEARLDISSVSVTLSYVCDYSLSLSRLQSLLLWVKAIAVRRCVVTAQ
jgi:hypothetical protein